MIQRAMKRALAQGVTLKDVLALVPVRKKSDVPIVLFSYLNPLFAPGESVVKEARASGVDAMLVVDMPPDISSPLLKFLKRKSRLLGWCLLPLLLNG